MADGDATAEAAFVTVVVTIDATREDILKFLQGARRADGRDGRCTKQTSGDELYR